MFGGKKMNLKKVMFYKEDCDLIFQNDVDFNKFYCMDLEYGKVVDEWNVYDDILVVIFVLENKFVQMFGEQIFFGVLNNVFFCVDFCIFGNKFVESDKQ